MDSLFQPPANDHRLPAKPPLAFGPLVDPGLACALQLAYMYLLIAVDQPFGDMIDVAMHVRLGVFVVVVFALALTCVTMWAFYEIAEWRHRRR